jgi:hypothetical protein
MSDLIQAYRNLNSANNSGWLPHELYVSRPGNAIGNLVKDLEDTRVPIRALIAGQRGVGKTTEFMRVDNKSASVSLGGPRKQISVESILRIVGLALISILGTRASRGDEEPIFFT